MSAFDGWWGAPAFAGLLAAASAGALGIVLARRAGWGDAATGAAAARKLQERPVPPVGGPAILVGLAVSWAVGGAPWPSAGSGAGPFFLVHAGEGAAWACLLLAFATGLVDDLRPQGLSPRAKLAGQAAAGLALAAPAWGAEGVGAAIAISAAAVLAVCFATNVWNTFDNADGVAGGLAAVGLGAAGAPGLGAVLGFLPWNLARPRATSDPPTSPGPPTPGGMTGLESGGCAFEGEILPPARRRPAPFAYLGDSGSHLLGVVLLLCPAAWPVFLLPAADLARLALARWRAGRLPWQGDRRHLAHRLEERGLPPLGVVAVLLAIGALPLLLSGALGLAAGLAAFALALAMTPAGEG